MESLQWVDQNAGKCKSFLAMKISDWSILLSNNPYVKIFTNISILQQFHPYILYCWISLIQECLFAALLQKKTEEIARYAEYTKKEHERNFRLAFS